MTLKLLLAGKDRSSFQPIKTAFDDEDAFMIMATSIALALFLARKNQPHLVICEEQLIDGDGLTLFHEIRNEPDLLQTAFAFLLPDKHKQSDILSQLSESGHNKNIHWLYVKDESERQDQISNLKNQIFKILA